MSSPDPTPNAYKERYTSDETDIRLKGPHELSSQAIHDHKEAITAALIEAFRTHVPKPEDHALPFANLLEALNEASAKLTIAILMAHDLPYASLTNWVQRSSAAQRDRTMYLLGYLAAQKAPSRD